MEEVNEEEEEGCTGRRLLLVKSEKERKVYQQPYDPVYHKLLSLFKDELNR